MDLSYRTDKKFRSNSLGEIILPEGVTYSRGPEHDPDAEIKFPAWRSWAGLNGWCETIQDRFGWSRSRALIALMAPTEDCDWVAAMEEGDCDLIVKTIGSPFVVAWDSAQVRRWLRGYRKITSLRQWLDNAIDKRLCPKSPRGFSLAVALSRRGLTPFVCNWFNHLSIGAYNHYAPIDMYNMTVFGKVTPKLSKLYKYLIGDRPPFEAEVFLKTACDQIDVAYLDFTEECTVSALLKAGVHPTTIVGPNYTKAEATALVSQGLNNDPQTFQNRLLHIYMKQSTTIPEGWWHEVHSRPVADWAEKHMEKLSQSREIHGPGGQVQTMHYHRLLSKVTPAMLPQGAKTAWRKVIASLEEEAQRQIQAELGEDVSLPTLRHPEIAGVTRIKTSFALKEEGEKMEHCVGSYVRACIARRSYIYHVGSPAPGGATLEVCQNPQGDGYVAQQLLGYRDQAAPVRLWAVAKNLVKKIK